MADEVATGVWWLAGTRGSNVFAIELPGQQFAIVDSGFPGQAEAIVREIRSLPGEVTPSLLLLTHGRRGESRERRGRAARIRSSRRKFPTRGSPCPGHPTSGARVAKEESERRNCSSS